MRKVILIITVLIFISHSNSQGWVQQNSGTLCTLNSVFFTDVNTGYTAGDSGSSRGVILKTTDSGLNWVRQINTSNGILSIFFIDANTGFACGGAFFCKTTNGGANWNGTTFSDVTYMYSLYFVNSMTGFMAGYKWIVKAYVIPVFKKTTDGGLSWTLQTSPSPSPGGMLSVYFPDGLTGYSCGDGGVVAKTTNTGMNWTTASSPGPNTRSIYFMNTMTGWVIGSSNVYKTTTGGNSWTSLFNQGGYGIRFTSESTGWICGSSGTIYGTVNGGVNWTLQSSGTTPTLRSICFVNGQTGWAVGDFGKILKTTTGGITAFQHLSNEIPEHFSLSQNYPNPFNPTTHLRFEISDRRFVKLLIFDIMGKEISTPVNEQLNPGTYEVEFDGSNYPSGVYYYMLTSWDPSLRSGKDYSETKKMVLVK